MVQANKAHKVYAVAFMHRLYSPFLAKYVPALYQGSHASWKVLDFFGKISSSGRSWKMILVLGSPGNLS